MGRLEMDKPKPVGFLGGTLPVPTDKAFHHNAFNSAIVPSSQTITAPWDRMLPTDTDLNTPPFLPNLRDKVLPISAATGALEFKTMATTKLYIVYYSMYGHVSVMAREVQRGANSVEGVEATLWQVPETLSDRILEKMKAPSKAEDVAVIRPEQLVEADGFLFGFPSRFGMMPAQFLAFFDAGRELCKSQALAGKPAGVFWSTGFHGGGQENSALTAITQLAHLGMLFVPLGYTFGSGMFEMNEVKGGSSYGAGTYAGDGSRTPTELELQQAFFQGKYVAGIAKKLKQPQPVVHCST